MRSRAGVFAPGWRPWGLDDRAERSAFITGQRVQPRRAALRIPYLVRWLALGAALTVLALGFGALASWLLTSPRFAVTQVDVRGLNGLSEAEVRAQAGIEAGANLFTLDPETIARRLQQLPRIKDAQVVRSLPNRVTLFVEERQPFALALGSGRLYWVDEEGILLGPEPRAVAPGLPVILGGQEGVAKGSGASGERVRAAVALLRAILRSASSLAARISEIDAGTADEGPTLYTVDGVEVKLGAHGWLERLGRLEGVLAQREAQPEPLASIDLRFRDQVVLKLKE